MLTITQGALEIIREHKEPVFLEVPKAVSACCFSIRECPMVRFGVPHDDSKYEERTLQDVVVRVPRGFSDDTALTIAVSSFLGFKRLVIEGWRLV
jgi:hypothetical protein